ncbi:putative disease resistance RPP13-like protein 1 [Morella rubra]|uniref:Putative disease resistance RPP13-like protein 1 n=1 Tax=Morella rubra TaxID=262757 RepID=A0A6A1WNX5_9ROSI|nr:putative disease resistance RPP13-like protein 1 [Morella rubra]
MAAEVGGALLSAFLQFLVDRLASPEVLDFLRGRKLIGRLLSKLRIKLLAVNVLVEDAEEKQATNDHVKKWHDELKDAVFDAEDILDKVATQALQRKLDAEFETTAVKRRRCRSENIERLPTTCLVEESGIVGRNDEKEEIVKEVLSYDGSGRETSVIAIVGMGGIGKTTLAQLVYNDERVKEHFDLKAWICVSDEFDLFKVTKAILEAVTSSTSEVRDLNRLQVSLNERLTGKKFVLVLDDVWNNSFDDWEILSKPLKSGAPGSKVIVTTRHDGVSSAMRACSTHYLDKLPEEDCWSLFANKICTGQFSFRLKVDQSHEIQDSLFSYMRTEFDTFKKFEHLYEAKKLRTFLPLELAPEKRSWCNLTEKEMPMHLGNLKGLQTLSKFIVSKHRGCGLGELGKLANLRGALSILELQNVESSRDAVEAKLMNKKYLENLELYWDDSPTSNSESQRSVLDNLQPHTNLKSLTVNYYSSERFPNWVGHHSFSNIASLCLENCKHCCSLPPLGQLHSLQNLSIVRFPKIVTVGSEFYGIGSSSMKPFGSLKVLKFKDMLNWETWFHFGTENEGGAFPSLGELNIKHCPKLTGGFSIHLLSLAKLEIHDCPQLVISLRRAPVIRELG